MKTFEFEQQTPEWYAIRAGRPTASSFDKIVTTKGEPSKQSIKYLYKLAGEFVSGQPEETYQNGAMLRGCEMEEEARNLYQVINDVEVQKVGFCLADSEKYGASPDGLIGEDGLLEIKCPTLAVHVEYLLGGKMPSTYFQQVQGQLLVTGRKYCDFLSYYPAIKPFIVRVERDKAFLKALEVELEVFCQQLEETINKIK